MLVSQNDLDSAPCHLIVWKSLTAPLVSALESSVLMDFSVTGLVEGLTLELLLCAGLPVRASTFSVPDCVRRSKVNLYLLFSPYK